MTITTQTINTDNVVRLIDRLTDLPHGLFYDQKIIGRYPNGENGDITGNIALHCTILAGKFNRYHHSYDIDRIAREYLGLPHDDIGYEMGDAMFTDRPYYAKYGATIAEAVAMLQYFIAAADVQWPAENEYDTTTRSERTGENILEQRTKETGSF